MEETSSLAVCKQLAEILTSKGLKAYYGRLWDGSSDYNDSMFWYFFPRGRIVGVYVQYDGDTQKHTYDAGEAIPALDVVLTRVKALEMNPSRNAVWEALEAG